MRILSTYILFFISLVFAVKKNSDNSFNLNQNINLKQSKNKISIFFIIFFAFITTFSLLDIEFFDWDIASHLIVAQDSLRGNLPLTNMWETKNILAYFIYSIPLIIDSNNIILVKVFNFLIRALLGISIFNISKKILNDTKLNFYSALFFLIAISIPYESSELYSEYILLIFYAPVLNILFTKKINNFHLIIFCLFSYLTFLISSFSYILLFVTNLLFFYRNKEIFTKRFTGIYFLSYLVLILATLLTYKASLPILIHNLIYLPLKYPSVRNQDLIIQFLENINIYFLNQNYILFGFLTYFLILFFIKKSIYRINQDNKILNILIFFSILTYFVAGKSFWHHLIILLFMLSFSFNFIKTKNLQNILGLFLVFSILLITPYSIRDTGKNITDSKLLEKYSLYQTSVDLQNEYDIKSAFALKDHLILFYLDIPNASQLVHPSNHKKLEITQPLEKLNYYTSTEINDLINNPSLDMIICDIKECAGANFFFYSTSINIDSYIYLNKKLIKKTKP